MLLCVSTPKSCACSACSLWRIYSAMTAIQLTLVRHLLEADDYICSSPVALLHYCPVATLCCPPWPLTRLHHHNPCASIRSLEKKATAESPIGLHGGLHPKRRLSSPWPFR